MKQEIQRKVLSLLLAVLTLTSCLVPVSAASFQYDAQAAVAYAAKNWNVNDGTVCDQFVKNCLHAGGVTIRAGGVDEVKNALVDAGFGTLEKVNVTQNPGGYITSQDNPGVKAGDVLFFYCHGCGKSTHVVLIAGFDENGNMQTYGHNPPWNLVDWMANFKHETDDGDTHGDFDFYVVKMDTSVKDHRHDFGIKDPTDLEDQDFEKEHPHRFVDQCKVKGCDAKYYLGWVAQTTNCYICNPSPNGIPVVTAVAGESEGKPAVLLSWTAIKDVYTYEVLRARGDSTTFFSLGKVDYTTMTNTSGEAGVKYRYKVKAGTVESEVVSIYFPGELVGPVLQGELTEDVKVSLRWNDCAADHYEVYRKASNEKEFTEVHVTNPGELSFSTVRIRGGLSYVYKVRAVFADGTVSPFGNEVTIDVPVQTPVLSNTTTDPKVATLAWTEVRGAVKYEVHRRAEGGKFGLLSDNIERTSFKNSSVTPGKTYEYKIRAVFSDGTKGNFSNIVTISIPSDEPTQAPVLSANGLSGAGKPKLKWNGVEDAVKYRVYRRRQGSSSWSSYTIKSLTYTHISAEAGKTYEYQVCAVYANGKEGPRSNTVTVSVPGKELPATPVLSANGFSSAGKPKLKWTQAKNAVTYRVYRRMEGTGRWTSYTINSLTYTHLSVVSGKTYTYQVCAVYANGREGPRSNMVTMQIPGAGEASALGLSVGGVTNDGKTKLLWTEAKDAVRYCVYRRLEGTSEWNVYVVCSLPYTYAAAADGKVYEYQVCALYANGKEGPRSNTVAVQVSSGEPAQAPVLSANGLSNVGKPKLKWTKAEGAVTYRVYRLKDGASKWTSYTINSLTYTHLSAAMNTSYEYKVCPIYADGTEGPFSNTVEVQSGSPKG